MTRTLLRFVPLVVAVGAVVGAVLLITQPWEGGEAESSSIKYRLCNTVVEAPPIGDPLGKDVLSVARYIDVKLDKVDGVVQPVELIPELEVWLKRPTEGERTEVSIDPVNGTVTKGQTVRTEMLPILETVRREELDRSKAPWPYTDSGRPTEQVKEGAFKYLQPDPASGIVVSLIHADGDQVAAEILEVANCQSVMYITAEFPAGVVEAEAVANMEFVQPEDKAAFDAFFQAVSPKASLVPSLEP